MYASEEEALKAQGPSTSAQEEARVVAQGPSTSAQAASQDSLKRKREEGEADEKSDKEASKKLKTAGVLS